jgi:uncharacterized Zn-binding protein involved in type VI secretion
MNIARLGDKLRGICKCHGSPISVTATIITASPDTFANGLGVARLGDTVKTSCGHYGKIVTASPDTFANGLGVARLGDTTSGCFIGSIITASPDTLTT